MDAAPYEYFLRFWGEVLNEDQQWIARDLGITETNHWFASADERTAFRKTLATCADTHKCCIAFAEYAGRDTRLRTVAHMDMRLPDGRVFGYAYDFGYAYPPDSARYMWHEGNYSCDCNRSSFLADAGHNVAEMDCGESIELTNFCITQEA